MPAGEIARHALPRQSAREQSAGATRAGPAPTTTEGWGGTALCLEGGGGASLWEGLPALVTLVPSPAVRGGRAHLCETEAGCGGGLEGPPVRGPAGPRLHLLPAAPPPRQGVGILYGLFPCVPVPRCAVSASRAADRRCGEWGRGGTGECSWASGGRVACEGVDPRLRLARWLRAAGALRGEGSGLAVRP